MDKQRHSLVVIGGSAGALTTVLELLSRLSDLSSASVIVVLHRKLTADETLADVFASRTRLAVKEVEDKDVMQPGQVFLAPAEYHVLVEKDGTLSLDYSEKVNFCRPSIDVTFQSAAEAFGNRLICILLSGANADGVAGLVDAKKHGACIVVQDPKLSEFPEMPEQAVKRVEVDMLLRPDSLGELVSLINRH